MGTISSVLSDWPIFVRAFLGKKRLQVAISIINAPRQRDKR